MVYLGGCQQRISEVVNCLKKGKKMLADRHVQLFIDNTVPGCINFLICKY